MQETSSATRHEILDSAKTRERQRIPTEGSERNATAFLTSSCRSMRESELARVCQLNSFPPSPVTYPAFLLSSTHSAMLRPQFLAQSSRTAARRLYSSRGPLFFRKLHRNGRLTPHSTPVTSYMHPVCTTRRCPPPSLEETKLLLGYAIIYN